MKNTTVKTDLWVLQCQSCMTPRRLYVARVNTVFGFELRDEVLAVCPICGRAFQVTDEIRFDHIQNAKKRDEIVSSIPILSS